MHLATNKVRRSLVAVAAVSMLVIGSAGPAAAAPANDSYTTPQTIRQPLAKNHGVSVTGSNVGASTQPGEPDRSCDLPPSATVWYRYVPRRNHHAFAKATSRQSNEIHPVVAVYQESPSTPQGPHELGCDTDIDGNGAARVNFEAVRGYTYLISVDGTPCTEFDYTSTAEGDGILCEVMIESSAEPISLLEFAEGNFTLYVK